MEYFLKRKKDVAAEVGVPDGIGDSDVVVFWKIVHKLHDSSHLIADDGEIGVREHFEERGVLAAAVEIVQSVQVGPQVADHHPAALRFCQYLQ